MNSGVRHIFVISHRRSGTHLTIDAICNNFTSFENAQLLVVRQLEPGLEKSVSLEAFKGFLAKRNTVLKSHFLPDLFPHLPSNQKEGKFLENLLGSTPKIYIYRDGRDVMVSLYNYLKSYHKPSKGLSFKSFLRSNHHFGPEPFSHLNRVEFWKVHVETWLEKRENILFLSFEELVNHYDVTLDKIAEFLNLPVNGKKIDVRLKQKSLTQKIKSKLGIQRTDATIKRTHVLFNKGVSGDYKNYFDAEDLDFFYQHAGDLMKRLGYD